MILFYLFIKGMQACVWCLGWLVWGCLAFAGLMLVAFFALLCIPLHTAGQVWHGGMRSLRPPEFLIRKSRG